MNSIRWAQQFGNDETMQFLYAGGLFGVLAAVNESVERAYWLNLGLVFVIVYLCLYLTYRSLLVSTILMIPVVLSQLAAEAFMVLAHIDLNVNSLPVAAAGAGVGVDYGIYHFSRMTRRIRHRHATRRRGRLRHQDDRQGDHLHRRCDDGQHHLLVVLAPQVPG